MTARRTIGAAVVCLVLATGVSAQTTQADTVLGGGAKHYSFIPTARGQITATLSWDNGGALLALILTCGDANPLTYGIAAGGLDRTARLEAGLVSTAPCLLSVASISGPTASYRVLVISGAGIVTGVASGARAVTATAPMAEQVGHAIDALVRAAR